MIKNAGEEKYAVLSDILGDEDHLGDMDFKVTGTKDGITATQMDIKVDGLSYEILERALNQAKEGRMHILGKIEETISEPRTELKDHAPRIETMTIPKEFIGAVIGPGGKSFRECRKKQVQQSLSKKSTTWVASRSQELTRNRLMTQSA